VPGVMLFGVMLLSRPGAAETRVHFEYRAHAGCPPPETFLDQLRQQGRELRRLEDEHEGPELVVRIDPGSRGSTGQVELRATPGQASSLRRTVDGESCEDVVRALVFVTVMLFDAQASEVAGRPRVPPESTERARTGNPPANSPEPLRAPTQPNRDASSSVNPDQVRERTRVVLGAAARVSSLFGATKAGGEIFSELPVASRSGWVARMSFGYVPDSLATSAGSARLTWLVGDMSGCWLGLAPSARIALGPCVSLQGGEVLATGRIPGGVSRSETALWFAAGPSVLVTAHPGRTWLLEVGGGASMVLTRHDFVFRDAEARVPVRALPVAGLWGEVGLGVRLP
jgi:hypothetical protein